MFCCYERGMAHRQELASSQLHGPLLKCYAPTQTPKNLVVGLFGKNGDAAFIREFTDCCLPLFSSLYQSTVLFPLYFFTSSPHPFSLYSTPFLPSFFLISLTILSPFPLFLHIASTFLLSSLSLRRPPSHQVSESGQHQLQHAGRAGRRPQEEGAPQLAPQCQEAVRGRSDGPKGEAVPVQHVGGVGRGKTPNYVSAV